MQTRPHTFNHTKSPPFFSRKIEDDLNNHTNTHTIHEITACVNSMSRNNKNVCLTQLDNLVKKFLDNNEQSRNHDNKLDPQSCHSHPTGFNNPDGGPPSMTAGMHQIHTNNSNNNYNEQPNHSDKQTNHNQKYITQSRNYDSKLDHLSCHSHPAGFNNPDGDPSSMTAGMHQTNIDNTNNNLTEQLNHSNKQTNKNQKYITQSRNYDNKLDRTTIHTNIQKKRLSNGIAMDSMDTLKKSNCSSKMKTPTFSVSKRQDLQAKTTPLCAVSTFTRKTQILEEDTTE